MREVFLVEESGHDFQDVVGVFTTLSRAARFVRRRYKEFAEAVIEVDAYMERKGRGVRSRLHDGA